MTRSFIPLLVLPFWGFLTQPALALEQQPLRVTPTEFRDLRVEDAGDFATVIIDAFSQSPSWNYIHQFADDHPGYLRNCMVQSVKEAFSNGTLGSSYKVIAVPEQSSRSGSRVVSISIWNFNKTTQNSTSLIPLIFGEDGSCAKQLDVNQTRSAPYVKHLADAEKVLDYIFERQAYLELLATHPKWDGHGFAARHLDWGMDVARNMGLPATLIATPAGYPLYKSKGFQDVANVTLDMLDGLGILWHEAMKYSA